MNSIRFSNAIAFVLMSLLSFYGVQEATFSVINNNDSGVGSLRQAILDVNASGDATNEIVVALSDIGNSTILLQSELPAIINQVCINGSDQNSNEILTIDGSIAGDLSHGLEIDGAVASGSIIQSFGIQDITNDASSAYGISIINSADDCSIINTIITSISSSEDFARGIVADSTVTIKTVEGNTVSGVSSSSSLPSSFTSVGIEIVFLIGSFANNTVSGVSSSASSVGIRLSSLKGNCDNNAVSGVSSASSFGIEVFSIVGNFVNNTVSDIFSSSSSIGIILGGLEGNCTNNTVRDLSSPSSEGILISSAENRLIARNTVLRVTGTGENFTTGIRVNIGDHLIIQSNVIDSVVGSVVAEGLQLGSQGFKVTNSLVSFNIISHIIGSSNNGFGISLTSNESTGNDLLNNSIFDINGKAINIVNNRVAVDARVVLTSVRCVSGCKLVIEGGIIPLINAPQFKLQFFVSDSKTPEQTQTFIAEEIIKVPVDLSFTLELTGLPPITTGQFITATATALPAGTEENNNTSEVSNALPVCNPNTADSICQCAPETPPQLPLCSTINLCNL